MCASLTAPTKAGEYGTRGDYHRHPDKRWQYYPVYVEKMRHVHRYLARVPKSARIVDLGCGEGVLVDEYRRRGYRIEGVDLNYASDHVRRGDVTALDMFADETFDVILALDVIEHLALDRQAATFAEIHRLLKPSGTALVSLPNLAHLASRVAFLLLGRLLRTSSVDRHPGDRPIGEYLRLADECGLELVSRRGLFPTLPLISLVTLVAPARAVPLHRLVNLVAAVPSLCFLNLLELRKRTVSA